MRVSEQRSRWREWLASPVCRDPHTGLWFSWVADDGSGYPYEEATAWALGAGVKSDAAVEALYRALRSRPLARHGVSYLFDTAVALDAAITLHAADHPLGKRLQKQAWSRVQWLLKGRRSVAGGPSLGEETASTRWSDAFGAHMLWILRPLARLRATGVETDEARAQTVAVWEGCRADPLPKVHGASAVTYAHVAAYAAEGLSWGDAAQRDSATAVTVALLDIAAHNGGLIPAFVDHGPLRSDVSAQTWHLARLLGVDHPAVAQIQVALESLTTADGGIRYQPDSPHINTCATVFALRAAEFVANGTFVQ